MDTDARCAIIHEMQQEEWDNGGFIIPFFNNLLDGVSDYVKGFGAQEPPQPRPLRAGHEADLARRLTLEHMTAGWVAATRPSCMSTSWR